MTSTHRLIAIIVVWIAVALIAFSAAGVAISRFMSPTAVIIMYGVLVGGGALATWFIARSAGSKI